MTRRALVFALWMGTLVALPAQEQLRRPVRRDVVFGEVCTKAGKPWVVRAPVTLERAFFRKGGPLRLRRQGFFGRCLAPSASSLTGRRPHRSLEPVPLLQVLEGLLLPTFDEQQTLPGTGTSEQ